jgi:ABC-2 type transport system ATP-binding protein
VLGLDPARASGALRARIGVQLQTTAFMQDLTVTETLKLYGALYPPTFAKATVGRQASQAVSGNAVSGHVVSGDVVSGFSRINLVLQRVDLVDKAKAMVRGLSGGQRQRLALAMAMLHDPDLYILDEPTSGLDPVARRQIHDILLSLKQDGRTVLISSHYLDEIEALADRVVILSAGEIVADGTPLELLGRAAGASTLGLAVTGATDPARLVPNGTFDGLDGGLFRYRTPDPTTAILGLAEGLRTSGARLDDLRLKRPSLEDVYLQLIGAATADGRHPTSEARLEN